MQQTRQYILDILRESGEATVDELVSQLQMRHGKEITPVTVRHHLNLLQTDELVTTPELRRKSSPGRPQHVYALTERAHEHFPHNYRQLAAGLVTQIERTLSTDAINVIFEGVAQQMAADVEFAPDATVQDRLGVAVEYLNAHGYSADYEACADGYMLYTRNCPYHHLVDASSTLCHMDMRLVAGLIGVAPRLMARKSLGDPVCAYFIPSPLE